MHKLSAVIAVLWLLSGSMSLKGQQMPDTWFHHTPGLSFSVAYSAADELLPEGYGYSPLVFLSQYRFAPFGAFNLYAESQFARAGTVDSEEGNYGFGLNLGISYHIPISPAFDLLASIGSGPYYITVETRRQAKGFIFSDNVELGFNYLMPATPVEIQLRARFRHISNAGLKSPNGGIDNLFLIVGVNKLF